MGYGFSSFTFILNFKYSIGCKTKMQPMLLLSYKAEGLICSWDLCISNASFAALDAFKSVSYFVFYRGWTADTQSCKFTFYRCIDPMGQMALVAEDRGYIFSSGILQGRKGMFYPPPSK